MRTPIIDLVMWNKTSDPAKVIPWRLGQVWQSDCTVDSANKLVRQISMHEKTAGILFWDSSLGAPDTNLVWQLFNQKDNLWHAGLSLGTSGLPGLINFVFPTWMFNRDPAASIAATSWRVSLRACLVRTEVIRQMGFLDPGFQTLQMAALDWGHRCLVNGVFCRHQPELIHAVREQNVLCPAADELRFSYNRFGKRWALWATQRALLSGYWSLKTSVEAWGKLSSAVAGKGPGPYQHRMKEELDTATIASKVSVLVPTVDRYPYLHTLLQQLRHQTIPATEIIVIDQTPPTDRQPSLFSEFRDLPLRVLYQEKAGQCSSRNAGLQESTGDLILFLDDDVEAPATLIEEHLANLQNFGADASSGTVYEVGSAPTASGYIRASDVFPAGNSMVRRQALMKSGLFDLAFDHGARADADLGMRLYLSGARMVLDENISILHHHAPRGGLRTHKARTVTYRKSRESFWQRNLASTTELYLISRYFQKEQQREHRWLKVLGTFSIRGDLSQKLIKAMIALVVMPNTIWQLRRNRQRAQKLLNDVPRIPTLL